MHGIAIHYVQCCQTMLERLVRKLTHSLYFIMYYIYPYFQPLIVSIQLGGSETFPQLKVYQWSIFNINIHDLLWTPSQNLPPPLHLENWPSSTAEYYRLDSDSFVATLKLYM